MAAAEVDPAAAVTTDLVTELEQRDIKFRTAVRTENRHSLRPRPPIMAIGKPVTRGPPAKAGLPHLWGLSTVGGYYTATSSENFTFWVRLAFLAPFAHNSCAKLPIMAVPQV